MGRNCSHCGANGHNSRTCTNGGGVGLRLFGVQLQLDSPMKKCMSVDCLSSFVCPPSSSPSPSSSTSSNCSLVATDGKGRKLSNGYLSDDLMGRNLERRKGVPWSEEEHRIFLVGLEKLGKGDWRGISMNFVTTRTPTQVASHAQKYFLRKNSLNKKRRSSLFDTVGSCVTAQNCAAIIGYEEGGKEIDAYRNTRGIFNQPLFLNLMPSDPSIATPLLTLQSTSRTEEAHHDSTSSLEPDLELKMSNQRSCLIKS